MSKVDNYGYSYSLERTEPHGSTVFLFDTIWESIMRNSPLKKKNSRVWIIDGIFAFNAI